MDKQKLYKDFADIDQFKNELYDELTQHLLPFWNQLIDYEYDGFYGEVDYDLIVHKEAPKGGIFIARLLWTYSYAYNFLKDESLLSGLKHSYYFFANYCLDKDGAVLWLMDFKGNPIDTRKHIYAQAFGIYALSEYYKATKDEDAKDKSIKLFRLIEEYGYQEDSNGYLEEFNREWNLQSNEMLSENGVIADMTTNTHLHILEAYTNLYLVWPDKGLEIALLRLINIFYKNIYSEEGAYLKVFFDKEWKSILNLKSYGHDIEACWLLDEAICALGLKDNKLNKMIASIEENIKQAAIMSDGSLINEKENQNTDYTRVWWGQSEAMVGFMNAYHKRGNSGDIKLCLDLWNYIKHHFVDYRVDGEWYWSIEKNGSPTKRSVVEPWKTPYHNVRGIIKVLKIIEEIERAV